MIERETEGKPEVLRRRKRPSPDVSAKSSLSKKNVLYVRSRSCNPANVITSGLTRLRRHNVADDECRGATALSNFRRFPVCLGGAGKVPIYFRSPSPSLHLTKRLGYCFRTADFLDGEDSISTPSVVLCYSRTRIGTTFLDRRQLHHACYVAPRRQLFVPTVR